MEIIELVVTTECVLAEHMNSNIFELCCSCLAAYYDGSSGNGSRQQNLLITCGASICEMIFNGAHMSG